MPDCPVAFLNQPLTFLGHHFKLTGINIETSRETSHLRPFMRYNKKAYQIGQCRAIPLISFIYRLRLPNVVFFFEQDKGFFKF